MNGFWAGLGVAVLMMLLLPNCTASSREIERATEVCAANDGLREVRPAGYYRPAMAFCKNGAEFTLLNREPTNG